jgi:polysaccharide biosynthesis transport protein
MSFHGINPNSAEQANGAEVSFAVILAGLRARLGLIVRVTVAVVALAAVIVTYLPTRYVSSAVVMLDPRKNTIADTSAVLSALPTDPASLQNQIQVLESRDLAAEVIAKLDLYDDPEFNSALQSSIGGALFNALDPRIWFATRDTPPDPAAQRDAIIDSFLSHLWAQSLGLSTTITVSFSSRDAQKAARIANAVVETYVSDLVNAKLKASDATSAWLTQRIRQLAAQVQVQEAAALTYRAEHDLDSSAGGTALIEAQLGGINGQIVQARADLSAKSAVYDQVQHLLKAGNPADISQIVASPLIIQLRTQQSDLLRQRAALAIPYGPKHPKRITIENELKDLDQKINEEGTRIASALSNDVAVARAQLNSLEGSLNVTQRLASGQDLTAVKLRALESEADSSRKLYEAFLGRLTQIQDQEGLQYPDAHMISRAPVPMAPASPQRALIVAASIPAGLLIGCLWALLAMRFAPAQSVRVARPALRPAPQPAPQPFPAAAPAYQGPPLLAEMPGALAEGAADHVIDWPASPFARAVTALLGRVAPAQPGAPARVIAVTTSEADRQATTVALALARAAAKAGLRTILVDGHFARPVLGNVTGQRPQAGLLEVLGGMLPLNRALLRDTRSAAVILPMVRPPRDLAAALASPKVGELFGALRGMCDLVIVASPPVLSSSEASSLARLSDAVVMVAHPEEGPRPSLGQALKTLLQGNSAPIGLVVVR